MKIIVTCLIILLLVSGQPVEIHGDSSVDLGNESSINLEVLSGRFFTRNEGQIPNSEVVFHSDNAYFTPTGVILRVVEPAASGHFDIRPRLPGDIPEADAPFKMSVFSTTFKGANSVAPKGLSELPHRSNFFIGNDLGKWATDVPNYDEIIYENLYDRIDLVYRAVPGGLKYEFIVHPGADATEIKIEYLGAVIRTDGQSIYIDTPAGTVVDGGLEVYQPCTDGKSPVDAKILVEDDIVSFDVDYDHSQELVIDPIIYSTFVGGSATDDGTAVALDSSDNAIITGYTWSKDFPVTPGSYQTSTYVFDLFVSKLNASGDRLIYSTYVGGSSNDQTYSIAIDSFNNTIIAGYTYSADFPTTTGAFNRTYAGNIDAMAFMLNPEGNTLIFSTYIGGQGQDLASSLCVDEQGIIYITGGTQSNDFPVTVGAYDNSNPSGTDDVFIAELSAGGDKLLYSTYFGEGKSDYGYSIDIDSSGLVYVTGLTSGGIVTKNAFDSVYNGGTYDAFAIKLSSDLKDLVYSTYLGGSDFEQARRIEVNSSGIAHIVGLTRSVDFPTTSGAYNRTLQGTTDGFLLSLKAEGNGLVFSTFLGGSQNDWINSFMMDADGDMIVTGMTYSNDFPRTSASEDSKLQDLYDCFIAKMESDGTQLLYSNYLGCGDANWLVLDSDEDAVLGGTANLANFPTTEGAYDESFNGVTDAFVLSWKLPTPPLKPRDLRASPGDREAQLNWSVPLHDGYRPVIAYSIYRGTDPGSLSKVASVGNVTSYLDNGIINGWKYCYAVSASNGVGEGVLSDVANVTPGAAPTSPKWPKAVSGDGYADLSWSKPDDNKGYPIIGYSIFRGANLSNLAFLSGLGNLTHFNDTSVSNGIAYFYAISAVNDMGESPLSDIVNTTPGKPPSAPTNLTAETGYSYIVLNWDSPEDNGGFDIEFYRIYEEGIDPFSPISEVRGRSCRLDDLENGKTYVCSVSAVNGKGEGERSEDIFVIPGSRPEAPSLQAESLNGQVSLSWSNTNDGGAPISRYRLYKVDRQGSSLEFFIETPRTKYDDLFVLNDNTYYYAVAAVNAKGEGNRSTIVSVTPAGDGRLPGSPVNLTGEPGNGYVLLSWRSSPDTGGLAEIRYRIYKGEDKDILFPLIESSNLSFNDTHVFNGVSYYYAISSINAIGEGERSAVIPVKPNGEGRIPSPPLGLSIENQNGSIYLKWREPIDFGGSEISGYSIFKGVEKTNLPQINTTPELHYDDFQWEYGIRYYYAVSCINAKGESSKTEISEIAIYDVPGAILNLTATTGHDYVLLEWKAPEKDGGSRIKEYQIHKARGNANLTLFDTAKEPKYNDTKVSDGFNYSYKITAVNDLGAGRFSDIIIATPGSPPGKPLNLKVEIENGKVRLEWEPPSIKGGFAILSYKIYRGSSEYDLKYLATVEGTTFLDTGIQGRNQYYYTVCAVNERGEGFFSETISITIPETTTIDAGTMNAIVISTIIITIVIAASIIIFMKRTNKSK